MTQFGDVLAPCGQCMPCRINKRRLWTGKILLEATHAGERSSFITLTYSDDDIPESGSLDTDHIRTFLDRLRKRKNTNDGLRFFAVGEYGDKTFRPHYHLAIFGIPPEVYSETLTDCWTMGHTHVGELEHASAAYLCGYATKKMTSDKDKRLKGRQPEFARMSKFPPLGYLGIEQIKQMLYTKKGSIALQKNKDVPKSYRCYGKIWPIGKYWLEKLREEFGIKNPPKNNDWVLDPEGYDNDQEKAQEVAQKLWRRRNRSSTRTL